MNTFELAAASVAGMDHVRAGRNNQDGLSVVVDPRAVIGVVTDGCGSGRHTEVGARYGARAVAVAVRRGIEAGGDPATSQFWAGVTEVLVTQLRELAQALDAETSSSAIVDYLLFTIVGFVAGRDHSVIFAAGDGVWGVNGSAAVLECERANEPDYLAYGLRSPRAKPLRLVSVFPTAAVRSVFVATDGATSSTRYLNELVDDDLIFRNPDGLRRRMSVRARPGSSSGLHDDTTAILLRRRRT